MRRRIRSIRNTKTYTLEKALSYGTKRASRAWNTQTRSEILSMRTDVLNARTTKAPYERKAYSKEREREKREPQRKSLGFHIQLRVYSNGSRAHFEGKLTSLSVSLRRPKERASETQTGEDRGFFCLFSFPSFVFCFRFIFEQTETFSL